jgi:hypothetical protein
VKGTQVLTLKMEAARSSETLVVSLQHYTASQPIRSRLENFERCIISLICLYSRHVSKLTFCIPAEICIAYVSEQLPVFFFFILERWITTGYWQHTHLECNGGVNKWDL